MAMAEYTEEKCSKCGQRLRIPEDVGGILMACPSCGEKFHSDFKIAYTRKVKEHRGWLTTIFELPYKILSSIGRRIFPR